MAWLDDLTKETTWGLPKFDPWIQPLTPESPWLSQPLPPPSPPFSERFEETIRRIREANAAHERALAELQAKNKRYARLPRKRLLAPELARDPQFKALLKTAQESDDPLTLGPAGDWLGERGATALGYAFVWAARRGHRPRRPEQRGDDWSWLPWTDDALPETVMAAIPSTDDEGDERSFRTFVDALMGLALALEELRRLWEIR